MGRCGIDIIGREIFETWRLVFKPVLVVRGIMLEAEAARVEHTLCRRLSIRFREFRWTLWDHSF